MKTFFGHQQRNTHDKYSNKIYAKCKNCKKYQINFVSELGHINGITKMKIASLLLLNLFIQVTKPDPDAWQVINRGVATKMIVTNKIGLWQITTDGLMSVLHDDTSWKNYGWNALDLAVNDDNGFWVTLNTNGIIFRQGISSSNILGTSWTNLDGLLSSIATSRYGLVFGHNMYGQAFFRYGLSSSSNTGSHWVNIHGGSIATTACSRRACFCTNTLNNLFTTGQMANTDSPALPPSSWIHTDNNVKDISAYGDKTLWKLDTNGHLWEAVNIFDNNFIKLTWKRRGYHQQTFKDMAVTNKKAYALGTDENIYVLTGCVIFDFEDNDISEWEKTGTAFTTQPVTSQAASGVSIGKVGQLCIDTQSSTNHSLADNSPIGTATSPLFQIRTDMLHFTIGGGSYPNNYISLFIDDVERFKSSGASMEKTTKGGKVRMGRFWWDVSSYKGKCAMIKMHDASSTTWGYTMFDDLRASPPCFKGMDAVLQKVDHDGTFKVGEIVTFSLNLKGFYTSATRPVTVNATMPLINGYPLLYFEDIIIMSTVCATDVQSTAISSITDAEHQYSVTTKFTNLLSDANIHIKARVYDHNDLQTGISMKTTMLVRVNFMNEYHKMFNSELMIKKLGSETSKLVLADKILNQRDYSVGENITFSVHLFHNYSASLTRAKRVSTKLIVPEYMKIVDVRGLNPSVGDSEISTNERFKTIVHPELLLGDRRTFKFIIQIVGDYRWNRNPGERITGEIILDKVYYCNRRDCINKTDNSSNVEILAANKIHSFNFTYKEIKPVYNNVFTKIADANEASLFICGKYQMGNKVKASNCYYRNTTANTWQRLQRMISNVTFYNSAKGDLYGVTDSKHNIKLFGIGFLQYLHLTASQWNEILTASANYLKASNIHVHGNSTLFQNSTMPYSWYCCK